MSKNDDDIQIMRSGDEGLGKRMEERQKELDRIMHENARAERELSEKKRLAYMQAKQARIAQSREDPRIHALNTIIQYCEPEYPEKKSLRIRFFHFNYEDMVGAKALEAFLNKAKTFDCFKTVSHSNGPGQSFICLNGINLKRLKQFKKNIESEIRDESPKEIQSTKKGLCPIRTNKETRWEQVRIIFTNEYDVVIKVQRDATYNYDYKKMGFADLRQDNEQNTKAVKSWDFLRMLTLCEGEFPLDKLTSTERQVAEANKKDLQKKLRLLFPDILSFPFEKYDDVRQVYKIKTKLEPDRETRDIYKTSSKNLDSLNEF
jgi:hypothetical protein